MMMNIVLKMMNFVLKMMNQRLLAVAQRVYVISIEMMIFGRFSVETPDGVRLKKGVFCINSDEDQEGMTEVTGLQPGDLVAHHGECVHVSTQPQPPPELHIQSSSTGYIDPSSERQRCCMCATMRANDI